MKITGFDSSSLDNVDDFEDDATSWVAEPILTKSSSDDNNDFEEDAGKTFWMYESILKIFKFY